MKKQSVFLLLVAVIIFSCKDNPKALTKEENSGDPVYLVVDDNKEMNQAIRNAVSTYDQFLTKFNTPDSVDSGFSVKMMFPYDQGHEHMWVGDIFTKESKLYGVLNNSPAQINSVKIGDTLEIIKSRVSDWMYLRHDSLVGGYTIRVLYNKMSEKEKNEFRNEANFIIE